MGKCTLTPDELDTILEGMLGDKIPGGRRKRPDYFDAVDNDTVAGGIRPLQTLPTDDNNRKRIKRSAAQSESGQNNSALAENGQPDQRNSGDVDMVNNSLSQDECRDSGVSAGSAEQKEHASLLNKFSKVLSHKVRRAKNYLGMQSDALEKIVTIYVAQSVEAVEIAVAHLRKTIIMDGAEGFLAVDCEASKGMDRHGRLCLVQLSAGDGICFLVDMIHGGGTIHTTVQIILISYRYRVCRGQDT